MFYQHISEKNYEIEFERLGIRTAITPLSDDELEECRRMKGADGARYALYLACPALHEEGEKLYKEGKLFSPLDIVSAVDMRDVKGAYQLIQEISGVGEARVRLYKNNRAEEAEPADEDIPPLDMEYGMDESFDVMERRIMSETVEKRDNLSTNDGKGQIKSKNLQVKSEMDEDYITILARKLRQAAENM